METLYDFSVQLINNKKIFFYFEPTSLFNQNFLSKLKREILNNCIT